ncbi:MAG: hypothetical protein U1F65_10735 [Verrucomicrobiota bacterium]
MGSTSHVAAADPFANGLAAAQAGKLPVASAEFRQALATRPAAGTLVNLGLVEWRRGQPGQAVCFWEQAAQLDPFDSAPRKNLEFAREFAQLETPELPWYETGSRLLPAGWWAAMACVSLWLAVALVIVPGVLRWRKAGWQQTGAAISLAVFILCLPPNFGVLTRANLGVVLEKKSVLRLTPTQEGELVGSLVAGEMVRQLRVRGQYAYVRTAHGNGWMPRQQLGLLGDVPPAVSP